MALGLSFALHRAGRLHPEQAALSCGTRRQDWRTLVDRVARQAGVLRSLGAGMDDRVGLLAQNSDRMIESLLACLWAGAVATPLNTRWSLDELRFGLQDAGVRLLLVDDAMAGAAAMLQAEGVVDRLVHIGDSPAPAGMLDMEALLSTVGPLDDAGRSGDELAFLIYTGGTTGRSKGVMLSHENLASASLGMAAIGCGTQGTFLHAVPLFHMAGLQLLCNHLLGGEASVVLPSFQPESMLRLLAAERIGSTMLVPSMLQMLVDHPLARSLDLGGLKQVFYGASPIAEAVLDRAMSVLPSAEFIQGYGMTETCITLMLPAMYHTAEGRRLGKLRTAGRPTPTAQVIIAGPDGRELPRGEPGEILARGPSIMRGYWNQPESSAQALRDGWMHSGDVGSMDEDGFVHVIDRLKDMIVSGGENIYSTEVENVLSRHPSVAQCAVIGVPDERWGERVHAVVVRHPGSDVDAETLMEHCKRLIAGYKCPRSFEFRDTLPMSAAGKLLKKDLRAPYWEGRGRGIA